MEKKELLDLMSEHKDAIDKIIEEKAKAANDKNEAEVKRLEDLLEAKSKDMGKIQDHVDNLEKQLKAKKVEEDGEQTMMKSMKSIVESDRFKTALKTKFRNGDDTFELKFDTGDITGEINRTRQNRTVRFDPLAQLSFIPNISTTPPFGPNEDQLLWVTGAYSSQVAYIGETVGIPEGSEDSATATEATRKMAKASFVLKISANAMESADYLVSRIRTRGIEEAMLWADTEFYSGDGNDGTQPEHIYGIVGQATPYVKPVGAEVADPNIGDLIDAAVLQARNFEQDGLDILWMNPTDFYRHRKTKDSEGQYIFQQVEGSYMYGNLRVVETTKVPQNTFTVARASAIQQSWKRSMEIKFDQEGLDLRNDMYTLVGFMRAQCLIEDVDKTAVINVSDIDAGVAGLVVTP